MPELIQEACTVEGILGVLLPLLQGGEAADEQKKEFHRLRQILGNKHPADEVAAMAAQIAA
jgi:lipid A disaccharide synthetase